MPRQDYPKVSDCRAKVHEAPPEITNAGYKRDRPFFGNDDLRDEQLARWAELVANGEVEFPSGLQPHIAEDLADQVRHLRRKRLIKFIAQAIARSIRDLHER